MIMFYQSFVFATQFESRFEAETFVDRFNESVTKGYIPEAAEVEEINGINKAIEFSLSIERDEATAATYFLD